MISFCTYRPSHPPSRLQPSLRLRCRDFTFISFHFVAENKARDVFETLRNLTCRLGRIEKVYAFSFEAPGPERKVNGWNVYNPVAEFRRQGVGEKSKTKGWRISKINADYKVRAQYARYLGNEEGASNIHYSSRQRILPHLLCPQVFQTTH